MKNKTKQQEQFCSYGARFLLKHCQSMEQLLEEGSTNKDIEYVQNLRATSQRIRAGLIIFQQCFPKDQYIIWMKQIKKITKNLDAARDIDVLILFLQQEHKNKENKEINLGVQYLLAYYKKQRAIMQKVVVSAITKVKKTKVLQEIINTCEKAITSTQIDERNDALQAIETIDLASQHIQKRLQDFIGLNEFVYKEHETQKHHKMRMKAKKLRYTLETFSDLYHDALQDDITIMKHFQDILEEMFDYDIWIEHIPDLLKNLRNNQKNIKELKASLNHFYRHIKNKRGKLYTQFVSLWEEQQQNDFFTHLIHHINTLSLSHKTFPKIAVISDIHGNLHAIDAVLEDIKKEDISLTLNLGDFTGYGAYPDEVVKTLAQPDIISIIGNYDQAVLKRLRTKKILREQKQSYRFARKNLSHQSREYLQNLPEQRRIQVNGKTIVMVHGSPHAIDDHIYPTATDEQLEQLLQQANADMLLMGHTHQQFVRTLNSNIILNPGSVGRPEGTAHQASYAIITTKDLSVKHKNVSYNIEDAVESIRKNQLPEQIAQMILAGCTLKQVIETDKQRKETQNEQDLLNQIYHIAQNYDPDITHSQQVTTLAVDLFNQTKRYHRLGNKDRILLTIASLLHDIGWSQGQQDHHKASLRLIMNLTDLPLTISQRCLIANIARYHTKKPPTSTHYHYKRLIPSQKKKVRILSGILRVADGLDASHATLIKHIRIQHKLKTIEMECTTSGDSQREAQAVQKKKELFEEMVQRTLVLKWKSTSL